jgi:hypothetical protein
MAASQNPTIGKNPSQSVTSDQIKTQFNAVLTAGDSAATAGVQNLKLVHLARLSQLKRTAAALTKKYGADDPRTKAAEAKVTATTTTAARLAIVHQQMATTPPPVAAAGWALHGRVYNSQLQPSTEYTVFLVDSQKSYQQDYGFAYTDDTGYFLINYAGTSAATKTTTGTTQTGSTQTNSTADAKSTSNTQTPAAGAQSAAQVPQLFLEIANAKGQPIYLSTTAFQPNVGAAVYQNVALPAGEPPIGDPPPGVASVALPPQKKSS